MSTEAKSPSQQAAEIAAQLAVPRPMRRGSIGERWMKCGQPSCPCHQNPQARHGPYFTITFPLGGKTKSRYLSPEVLPLARAQVASLHQFRQQVQALIETCERWADTELEQGAAAADEAAKKRGSKRPSTRKSSPKSKP